MDAAFRLSQGRARAEAPIPASVVVMTRDEADNLPDCLANLDGFAQVFVVDSASGDGTAEIARAQGATLVPFDWNGRYPKKKQWCLDTLPFACEWVLFVDADERVSPALAAQLAHRLSPPGPPPEVAAFMLDSRPVVLGRALRFGPRYSKIALMRRGRVRFPECRDLDVPTMWEVEGHYQPLVDGTVERLLEHLLHEDRKPPSAWFSRHNRYSDWEAALAAEPARRAALLAAEGPWRRLLKRLFARLPARPLFVFLHAYVIRLGALDGLPGLHHALARAFYYWQIAYKVAWSRAEARRAASGNSPLNRQTGSSPSPASAFTSSKARRRTDSSGIR